MPFWTAFLIFLSAFWYSPVWSRNQPIKVGLVLDKGGKDDKSFNASAFRGASQAKDDLGIHLKVIECSSDSALTASLRTFAQHDYDLIIGIGVVQKGPIDEVAKDFPQTHFLLIDAKSELPNVRSVQFQEHEGSFLVGVIGALTSKTKVVGFVGGMDIPLIRRFELGYRKGAQFHQSDTKVITHYIGSSSDSWRNPSRAKELAFLQFSQGADVIFCAAGSSCVGVFDAAEEKNHFAIGVDSNQNWVKPGTVLTSMVKSVDHAVYETIKQEQQHQFSSGTVYLGLANQGVSFSLDSHNRKVLLPEVEKKALEVKDKIVQGTLKVPDFYESTSR